MKEQKKLIYQNLSASEGYLAGYFADDEVATLCLAKVSEQTRSIAALAEDGALLPINKVGQLLDLNRDLRRLYDQTASRFLQSFDQVTTPLLGWKQYLDAQDR